MVLSKCYGFIKYALACVNLLCLVVGLVGVVLSIWILTDQTFLVSLAQEQYNFNAGLYILLAASILMLIVSFLGCYGTFRESQCMLVGFFSCLLVVIVVQIAVGAWLYTNSNRLEELVKSTVINTVKNEYGENEARTQTLDTFQSGLGCCGATGPADWTGSKYASKDPSLTLSLTVSTDANVFKVPESCCKYKGTITCESDRNLKVGGKIGSGIYNEGCIDKLIEALKSQSCIVIGVVIGIGVVQLLGLIFSLTLCCAIGSSDRYKA